MTNHHVRMGSELMLYQSEKVNLNRWVNNIFTSPHSITPSAVVIQEKEFPDVSFYQGEIDWDIMRSKTDTVIIRVGQNLWPDSKFQINWDAAKARGMKRGAYWFYDDRVSPGVQAQLVADLLQIDQPEMELWCDWEKTYGGSFSGLKNVVAFMQAVEQTLLSTSVGMYTGYYFFREHSNAIVNASQYNYLKTKPLWLAWYTSNPAEVKIPAPWTDLDLWQWGTPAVGAQYGVQSVEIDMNWFNGTLADFEDQYGETSMSLTYHKVKATSTPYLNIRSGPGSSFQDIGDLYPGDVVECDRTDGYWLHVVRYWRSNTVITTDGWCNSQYTESATMPKTLTNIIEVYNDGSVNVIPVV